MTTINKITSFIKDIFETGNSREEYSSSHIISEMSSVSTDSHIKTIDIDDINDTGDTNDMVGTHDIKLNDAPLPPQTFAQKIGPLIQYYKNSQSDYIIDLDVFNVVDSIIDDIVTANYNKNITEYNHDICEYYTSQTEYESCLVDILAKDEVDEIIKIINGITYRDHDFLFNLSPIKRYDNDSIGNNIRCGVFKTPTFIIKIDTSSEQFKSEIFTMFFAGKGIVKPYNIVLPYIAKIHERRGRYMSFSIQPRITNSRTLHDWIRLTDNKRLPINAYIDICIHVCKSILFIHSKHMVHGDIKPGNILIRNISNTPYLIDFGLSGVHSVSEGTGGTKPFCHPGTRNTYYSADDEDKYEWTKNYKYRDLWSVALVFASVIILRSCCHFYSEFPSDFFDSEKYVANSYLRNIPSQFRDPFTMVLLNPKYKINVKSITVRKFIDLLETGMKVSITPFDI